MGGNIIATAGNNINILAETLDNSYSRKEKSSGFSSNFSASGGGLTAGVSYNKSSLEQQSNGTTIAVSTLMSEGSTVLDAGNRIRTEAMQANIGEDLIIRGVNGVDLLDATETYEEKTKQKSSSIGVTASLGSTVTSFIDTANNMYNNKDKYGTENTSQLINTAGDGFTLFRGGVSAFNDAQSIFDSVVNGIHPANPLAGITANVSLSVSQSSYESNTSGTRSVAGNINVGGNMIVESEGDVRFINQKINVGENLIIDAKNFEARAGENTYTNDTKSSSSGANMGWDFAQNTVTGGVNGGKGNSNTTSKNYDNTVINAGGTFQLTTKEDATFAGANVTADKINFDIGKNLNIISLQDEYSSHGQNYSGGLSYSGKDTTTKKPEPGLGTASVSYGENNADAKWVSNQTSIIATNGGNVKVNETLTNTGAIIASINEPLNIEAKKLVTEDLKDYNNSENYNIGFSGIELNGKNHIPQTSVSYGSSDKEQNTNATFSNVNVTENGVKVDLEARGINTDLTKAQVITKDEVVEQIDTMLQTDLLNTETRAAFVDSVEKAADGLGDIGAAINRDDLKYEKARTGRYEQYYIESHKGMQELINDPGSKSEAEIKAETKAFIKYMTGKDVEVVIIDTGEGSGYLRGDQKGKDLSDVFILDMKQLAEGGASAAFIFGHEGNHTDDHRRGREANNEVDSDSSGSRLEEILGDKGSSKTFDLDEWKNKGSNGKALEAGEDVLKTTYAGMDIERCVTCTDWYKEVVSEDNNKVCEMGSGKCAKKNTSPEMYKKIMENSSGGLAPFKGIDDNSFIEEGKKWLDNYEPTFDYVLNFDDGFLNDLAKEAEKLGKQYQELPFIGLEWQINVAKNFTEDLKNYKPNPAYEETVKMANNNYNFYTVDLEGYKGYDGQIFPEAPKASTIFPIVFFPEEEKKGGKLTQSYIKIGGEVGVLVTLVGEGEFGIVRNNMGSSNLYVSLSGGLGKGIAFELPIKYGTNVIDGKESNHSLSGIDFNQSINTGVVTPWSSFIWENGDLKRVDELGLGVGASISGTGKLTLVIPNFKESGDFISKTIMDTEQGKKFMDDMIKDLNLNIK